MNRLTFVAILLTFAASCLAQDYARVRILHAFPGTNVNVSITLSQGTTVVKSFPNVAYKQSMPWFYVPWGTYNYAITLVGQQTPLLQSSVAVTNGRSFLLVALSQSGNLAVTAVSDDISTVVPDSARMQVFHAAVGVAGVDFGTDDVQLNNLASNLAFGQLSGSSQITPLPYTISVRTTGSTGNPVATVDVNVEVGRNYLVVAVGTGASGDTIPVELIVLELVDFAADTRVAFVHGITNATVDVRANDMPIFRNRNFLDTTEYYNMVPDTITLTVGPPGTNAITVTAFFNGFTEITLIATVDSSNNPIGLLVIDENEAPPAGQARVRLIHASGAAGAVDILTGSAVIVSNLAFQTATNYLVVNSGSLAVAPTGTTNAVFNGNLGLPANAVITVIALGNPTAAASSPSAFRLLSTVDALYGANGNVRAFHAVAGADQVDATAAGTPFFSGLVYKNISDYQSVAPGLYRLYFTTPGFDQAILRSALRVDAGGDFTAVLGGQIGGQLGLFQFRDDNNAQELVYLAFVSFTRQLDHHKCHFN